MDASDKSRTVEFTTSICYEKPSLHNSFIAETRYIQGYDCQQLWRQRGFMDVLLLHFIGELPQPKQVHALEMLFVGLMNLGPRDSAIRSAMLAGITKTRPEHLLPIGLLASQGERNGASEVATAHQFMVRHRGIDASICLQSCIAPMKPDAGPLAPGFGSSYGSIDPILQALAEDIGNLLPDSEIFSWCQSLATLLRNHDQGWLAPGLVAAMCVELGIGAREGMGLYQLAKSVGILAQGMEQTHLPIAQAPMLKDEFYEQI